MLYPHSSKLVDAVKFFSTFEQRNACLRNVVSYANHSFVCLSLFEIVVDRRSIVKVLRNGCDSWMESAKKREDANCYNN